MVRKIVGVGRSCNDRQFRGGHVGDVATSYASGMAPRPAPTPHDATARRFLNAAATVIDAMFDPNVAAAHPRLKSLHYPAALQWLRLEDLLRVPAMSIDPPSRKAFFNRWPDKDSFLSDAVIYALEYRDRLDESSDDVVPSSDGEVGRSVPESVQLRPVLSDTSVPLIQRITMLSESVVEELLSNPRSYLLIHLAPLFVHHPRLRARVQESLRADQAVWCGLYEQTREGTGCQFRDGWDAARVALTLQALLDGLLVRARLDDVDQYGRRWEAASFYADAAVALLVGVFDLDNSGEGPADYLTRRLAEAFGES